MRFTSILLSLCLALGSTAGCSAASQDAGGHSSFEADGGVTGVTDGAVVVTPGPPVVAGPGRPKPDAGTPDAGAPDAGGLPTGCVELPRRSPDNTVTVADATLAPLRFASVSWNPLLCGAATTLYVTLSADSCGLAAGQTTFAVSVPGSAMTNGTVAPGFLVPVNALSDVTVTLVTPQRTLASCGGASGTVTFRDLGASGRAAGSFLGTLQDCNHVGTRVVRVDASFDVPWVPFDDVCL